jgi:hypothetical protein
MTKRPYVVFPNGAPFPGTCVGCRSNIELHDLGADLLSGGNAMLCKQCVISLAEFNEWAPEAPLLAEIEKLKSELASKEAVINNIPNNIEGLINGIRNSVSDFVLTISGGSDNSSGVPVQEPELSNPGVSKPRKAKSNNS